MNNYDTSKTKMTDAGGDSMQRIVRCRHQRTWLIGNATYEWCYECGAFRNMREVGTNGCAPASAWCKPSGIGGENPYEIWEKQNAIWQKRTAKK